MSEKSLRRRRVAALAGFIAGTASRHSPSSIEESAAGTSSSLPPRCRLQYRRPRSGIRMAASTRAQPICLKLSATAPHSLWINCRVIELFCAQVFGIREDRPFDPQRRLSTIRVINLAGGVSRRTITRLTVERLTPIFRASSFCVTFGFAATSLAIFAQFPLAGGAAHGFALRLQCNSVAIRHPPPRRVA